MLLKFLTFFLFVYVSAHTRTTRAHPLRHVLITLDPGGQVFLSLAADFGAEDLTLNTYKLKSPQPNVGCTALSWQSKLKRRPFIAVVNRGNCTFLEKSALAQSAGAVGVIVVNNDKTVIAMSSQKLGEHKDDTSNIHIPIVMVGSDFKSQITLSSLNNNNDDDNNISANLTLYTFGLFDPTILFVILFATFLVGIGAYYSSDKERMQFVNETKKNSNESSVFSQRNEVAEINAIMAWGFVVVASLGLVIMFYFVSYLFPFILVLFCFGALNGMATVFVHLIEFAWPAILRYNIQIYSYICHLSDILAYIPSLFITFLWFWFRFEEWAWILQNLMCTGLLLSLQRTIRFTSLRIACILLTTAFFYDIFWVFISPYFFTRSVMVEVATYSHTNERDTLPVVLKFPKIADALHRPMILGMGDLALPGLFISYLLRFDYIFLKKGPTLSRGYFKPCLIGYAVGLTLTDISLIYMQSGQPALLYIVPCTLGLCIGLAYHRGDLRSMWSSDHRAFIDGRKKNHHDYKPLSPNEN